MFIFPSSWGDIHLSPQSFREEKKKQKRDFFAFFFFLSHFMGEFNSREISPLAKCFIPK